MDTSFFQEHWRLKKQFRREDMTPIKKVEVIMQELGIQWQHQPDTTTQPLAPGVLIQAVLDDQKLTQAELAQQMGVSRGAIHHWIHAQRDLTPENAIAFEQTLGIPADVLLHMQADYNLFVARHPDLVSDPVARHSTL